MTEQCSFCGRKLAFQKLLLKRNGHGVCRECFEDIKSLHDKKDYKIQCPSCKNPLTSFEEKIELEKIHFTWKQNPDGSLALVDMVAHDVYNKTYVCGVCGEEISLDPEIMDCKDRLLESNSKMFNSLRKKIARIISGNTDKDRALTKILKVLDRFAP